MEHHFKIGHIKWDEQRDSFFSQVDYGNDPKCESIGTVIYGRDPAGLWNGINSFMKKLIGVAKDAEDKAGYCICPPSDEGFPPNARCPVCGSESLGKQRRSGRADRWTIATFAILIAGCVLIWLLS